MIDGYGREINYVRVSVTDRCNLRCVYCMPADGACYLPPDELLTLAEIEQAVRALTRLGIAHVRITGGEPMAREGVLALCARIRAMEGVRSLSMTTNGTLLCGRMEEIRRAGIDSINISLDTLDAQTYARMTRRGRVEDVLCAIGEALALGIRVKINAVPVRGMNEEDLVELAALARTRPIDVRFIELMPLGCGAQVAGVPAREVRARLQAAFGPLAADNGMHGHGPAAYVRPAGFRGSIGLISPLSHAFCQRCNRIRLTADGVLKLCLNHGAGLDVRTLLRAGACAEKIEAAMREAIAQKPREHGFTQDIGDHETRRMHAIGG